MLKLVFRLRCLIAGHIRCANRVRREGESYRSVCARCGTPMLRRGKRDWVVASDR